MNREDIEEKYTWNLNAIYSSVLEFEQEYNEVKDMIDCITKYNDTMLKSANQFYETLEYYYLTSRKIEKLYSYANLLLDTDTSNNDSQSIRGRVSNLYSDFTKKSYFIDVNILKLDYSFLEKFYEEEPKLKKYEILLKNIFRYKDHTLSDSEEQILSGLSNILGNNYDTYELFKDCDLSFGDIELSDGSLACLDNSTYSLFIEDRDRRVRKDAFDLLYKVYSQYKNTFASLIYNNIKEETIISKMKKYNSAIECSLYHDDVGVNVYNNLIESVSDGLPVLYRYYELKKKVLGVSELHLYDVYVSMVKEYSKEYSFDDAVSIVRNALSVFGNEYIDIYNSGITNRWVDVYPTKSKRTGGYSGGSYDTYPYILLNYQNKYNDMSTLAHEMGHSIHSYYARTSNDYEYGDYSIFVAEVASTVNELLLARYMLNKSDSKNEKLYILNKLMELFRATIYRQTMFAEFERDIYSLSESGEILTADLLCDRYYQLNKKYFGDSVIVDDEIRYEWERIPHFYYDFYVYKYATGLSCACKIVDNILSNQDNAVSNYIEFLKCGRSKNPIDSLKVAGVDVTKREVIDSAVKMFDEVISEFDNLINS